MTVTRKRRSLGRGDAGHGELLEGQLLDVVVEGVHHLVAVGQDLGRLAVPGQEGVGGAGHRLAHQGEQLEDLAVDLFEGVVHADHRTPAAPPAVSPARRRCRTGGLGVGSGSPPRARASSPTMTRGPEPHDRYATTS